MNISIDRLESLGFDRHRISELVELFDSEEEVLNQIGEMYTDSSVIVPEILACIEQSDYQTAMQKLHYLKGGALGIGAVAIAQAATALEDQLRDSNQFADELANFKITWNVLSQELMPK